MGLLGSGLRLFTSASVLQPEEEFEGRRAGAEPQAAGEGYSPGWGDWAPAEGGKTLKSGTKMSKRPGIHRIWVNPGATTVSLQGSWPMSPSLVHGRHSACHSLHGFLEANKEVCEGKRERMEVWLHGRKIAE